MTYSIGAPLQDILDQYLVQGSSNLIKEKLIGAPDWFKGLLIDGVIGGAGTVLTFIPILLIFFLVFGFSDAFHTMCCSSSNSSQRDKLMEMDNI